MPVQDALKRYAGRIRDLLRANRMTPETGLAPAFQQLITELLADIPALPALTVVPEYLNPGVGRPDVALVCPGQPPRAFVELKAITKSADPNRWRDSHDRRQRERLQELSDWATCNFADFHLFHRAVPFGSASVVPLQALDPDRSDVEADRLIERHDPDQFVTLLSILARAQAPSARNAEHLAQLMAHSARLVRGIVAERLNELREAAIVDHPLLEVRETFRDVLYAHPEAGGYPAADFDVLFSAAFAQTLAFGLLLVREASGQPVAVDAWNHMPAEHPLMQAALRVLSLPEVAQDIGIGFDVMRDTVNSFAPEILAIGPNGRDPILYFYEDFLSIFDPAARDRYGVYYTPIEVVRYMSGALDRVLRDRLGTEGLRDPAVTILDPATGTGTFLLGVAERVREQVSADSGGVEAMMALRELAGRMYGFELLVGPYAVAHYRLHHALRRVPVDVDEEELPQLDLPRLGVYLTDTLARPGAAAPAGPLGFVSAGIREERHAADAIKAREPILAIIGNPPYKRLEGNERETLIGRWIAGGADERGRRTDGLWDDLKAPVSAAGHGNQLNTFEEFSVAFWRWAIWKLFESENAPQRGVIAFITNRKFLTGWPYAGLRQMMRQRFDRIEIIDLRGDVRAGVRGNVDADQGVFNIMVGTAITIAIADGSKPEGELAEIIYNDSWEHDLFGRRSKLDWLMEGAGDGALAGAVAVDRPDLDDFRPTPFQNGEWISLRELFIFSKSGMKSGDDAVFVSPARSQLRAQVAPKLAHRDNPAHMEQLERQLAYRPLDRRWLYNDLALLDRPGPEMQRAWGASNVGLYAKPSGTGSGPAVWCHSLLPDYHAFKGSTGGYAFPLYDRRAGPNAANLSPALIGSLSGIYGVPVSPEDVFDAVLCLLSATSYTRRFAEDLEDVFPHIPFPASHAVFRCAVAVGQEIRAIESFVRVPELRFRPPTLARIANEPNGLVAAVTYADGVITLCANGTGRLTGIPQLVWDFAVSGYRVLSRWLEGRIGQSADLAFVRELRDIAARIAELIHRFDEADLVLADTLEDMIIRDDLGLAAEPQPEPEQEAADE
ncbi:type ISP restriction/modification enzyme [Sphingomonas sp. CD22]|uniref:type ISP restriction/modification enzyme n=1 Tax=Sphingomonas sp. CD22 TaxID=3100214 RepID=UPI002ADF1A6B|nr:type ISP restriction/modification enzyme [Sphingomonas sp. CD22]MEA1084222.1 type ISP restriction/modification enzyme [Sphingomonas sp. CD22]